MNSEPKSSFTSYIEDPPTGILITLDSEPEGRSHSGASGGLTNSKNPNQHDQGSKFSSNPCATPHLATAAPIQDLDQVVAGGLLRRGENVAARTHGNTGNTNTNNSSSLVSISNAAAQEEVEPVNMMSASETLEQSRKLCGYLNKLKAGARGRQFKRRWFVFDDASCRLLYFSSPQDILPLGEIDVSNASFHLTLHQEGQGHDSGSRSSGGHSESPPSVNSKDNIFEIRYFNLLIIMCKTKGGFKVGPHRPDLQKLTGGSDCHLGV